MHLIIFPSFPLYDNRIKPWKWLQLIGRPQMNQASSDQNPNHKPNNPHQAIEEKIVAMIMRDQEKQI